MQRRGMLEGAAAAGVERPRLTAFLIAVGYCVVAILWIWGSDRALRMMRLPPEVTHEVEVWKGTGWVVFTSVVLFALIARPLVRLTRARAESQARAKELETVLDAVPVAVWIARDPACRVIDGNRIGREMLGQGEKVNLSLSAPSGERPEGFIVESKGRQVPPEELPVQLAARTGVEVRNFAEEVVLENGKRYSLLGNAVPLKDGAGRVTGAVGAFLDVTARERAVRELERNELILEQAQELGRIGSWVSEHAREGGALQWSRETCRIFGLAPEEFDGWVETFFAMVHPEDVEAVKLAGVEAKEGRREYEVEHRIIRADGAVRWVHERARIERGADGEPLRMIGVCQDITERMEAERALRESEERLRAAMDAANMLGWETDLLTWRASYSRDPAAYFGLDAEAAVGAEEGGVVLIHPDDRAEVLRQFDLCLESGSEIYDVTFRSAAAGDEERWYRATARVVRDDSGRAVRTVGVTQDITDKRLADERVRRSEARYRTIVETCQEGVWLVGKDWRTTFVNQRMAEMLGRRPEEMLGKTVLEFMPEDEREKTAAHMREREAGIAAQHEYRFVRPDGREVWALAATNAIMNEDGTFAGGLAMFTDITDRRRMEDTLRRSEEQLRLLFKSLPMPAWVYGEGTKRFLAVNDAAVQKYGYTEEQFLGKTIYDIRPERERAKLRDAVADGPRGLVESGGWKHLLADGRVIDVEVTSHDIDYGGVAARVVLARDVTESRKLEEAIRSSEARYRKLIEAAPEAIVVLDVERMRFVDMNGQAVKLFGRTREQLLDCGPIELSPELQSDGRRSAEAGKEHIESAASGAEPMFEWTHRNAEGVEVPCEIRLARLPDPERVLVRGSITDITERRHAEERLRQRDVLLKKLSEQVPGMIFQYQQHPDGHATFPYCSEGARMVYEVSPAELARSAQPAYDRIHPDDLQRVIESVRLSVEMMEVWQCEYRVVLPGRGVRWLEGHSMPERLADGSILWHGYISDITERRAADDALRASEEKYRLVLRATSDAMWDYEPATGLLRWGDNVETMFKVRIAEMGDRLSGWSDRLHPEDHDRALASFERAVVTGEERWVEEYRFRRGDGAYAVVLDRAYMLRDRSGGVIRVIGAMTDITERRQNEQLMSGQARALERLVGGEPLDAVLEDIIRTIESLEPGCMGSVLLLDEAAGTMRTAAAPSLPAEYSRMVDGARIGPRAGSCGTAMHRRERVIVTDIATDELWADFKDLAIGHGLRACWSEPVIGAGGKVLGSLAMYYREPRGPGEHELRTISWAARLAGLAIERRQAEEELRRRETELRDILNAVPDLMFRMDRDGRYLEHHAPNPAELAVPPEEFLGRTVREVLPADRAEQCMRAIAAVLRTGETQTYEYQVQGKEGARHWEVRVTRCAEEQVLLLVRNITTRRTAERRLRESEQRLSLLVRQSPLGVIVWDLDFRVAEWNAAAEHIFGWSAGEALGRRAEFILPESVRAQVGEVWKALKENRGGTRSTNANVTRDGRTIFCEWYNAPLINADGRVFAVASIVDDVTEQRMAQQRQQLMMAELDHRVKNNLAAVISLAEQSGRMTTTFADFRESFLGRVRALSRLHNALAATRWHGAHLGTMVRQTLEAFGQDTSSQAVVEGPEVVLPARAAQAMGMALNELCTNAIKYGALSVPGGRIEVRWAIRRAEPHAEGQAGVGASGAALELSWVERGGPRIAEPTRRGFGTELIEGAISYELGGSAVLRFEPAGLRCRIRIDLPVDSEFDQREMRPGTLDDLGG